MTAYNKAFLLAALGPALGATQEGHRVSDEEAMRRMQGAQRGKRHNAPKQSKQSKNQAKASRRKNRGK